MDPQNVVVQCGDSSFWLYKFIWGALLPLFVAYIASAAYTFQRRRIDIEVVHKAMKDIRSLTTLALNQIAGLTVDQAQVRESAMELVGRFKLELLHRPAYVQKMILSVVVEVLKNADVAVGKTTDTAEAVFARQHAAEADLINLVRQLTVRVAVAQAWVNPGIVVSFDSLLERFAKFKPKN